MTTDSGAPVRGAMVTITGGPDREVRRDSTDADGRWSITYPTRPGDYLVHIAALGRQMFRKRVTRGMSGYPGVGDRDSTFRVDAVLAPAAAAQLAGVQVVARRTPPARRIRTGLEGPGTGAAEHDVEGVTAAVPPDQAGDLAALAATTPGVTLTPGGGVSALGLGAGQTNVTLGGLAFTGTDIPRDTRTVTRVTTSTYDPSRGWFGGAQIAVELAPGSGFSSRRMHLTGDAPQLQATDPVGVQLGRRVGGVQASAGGDGGFADDRWTYNVGAQVSRRAQDAPSLLDATPDVLHSVGVAPDSAARLLAAARRVGIPVVGAGDAYGGGARASDQASFIARVDRPFFDYKTYEPMRRTYGLTGFGTFRRTDAFGVDPAAAPTRGAQQTLASGGLQGSYSAYVGRRDWLLDFRSGVSASDVQTDPYLALPGARVLVGSGASAATADIGGAAALVPVALGGNGTLADRRRTYLWETLGELRFYPPGKSRHRVSLSADARLDGVRATPAVDRFGTYTYQTVDDLVAGRPATFTRTLGAPELRAGVWNGFVALGDYWRVSDQLQLLYGVRLEGDHYATRPAYNPALDSALGVRTDGVPNRVAVLPRLGFTWVRASGSPDAVGTSTLGGFRLSSAQVLRGGIGEFRNLLGPDLVGNAGASTGRPGATRQLLCVGDAVPGAQWGAWSSGVAPLPATCAGAGGTTPGTAALSDTAPGVVTLDPRYTAPRSWRGNLSWSGAKWNVAYSVEGIYSLNLNQPGTVDANFAGVPRFTLAGENRPVYVPPDQIVPATGAIVPTQARRSAVFGRVAVERSDLRSVSRQLTVTLAPASYNFSRWTLLGAYTLGSVRQQFRGFDGDAFADPGMREWARGDLDVRHQFLLQAGYARKRVALTLFGRVQSGLPYTPLVGADVNGDGVANDRAFVFDPSARGTDSSVAVQMRSLLGRAPRGVRECLTRQLGGPATRNGCEGPWTATLNARLGLRGDLLHVGRRVNVGLNAANVLGGIDRLINGPNIRGWGGSAVPDPFLEQVRGFDPSAQRFRYDLNPRFGDTRPQATTLRTPFRLTLDVAVDIGRPLGAQQLDRWLTPGRAGHSGVRLTAAELKRRYARNVPDPYRAILQESDSLLLTRAQADSLEAAQRGYEQRVDSIWTTLADTLAALGDRYDRQAAYKRQEDVLDAVWELARQHVRAVLPTVLSPAQLRVVPWPADMLLQEKEKTYVRVFIGG